MLVPVRSKDHFASVIDIGSNSVRLVVYRIEGRSIWPVFNEKVLAGLGETLRKTAGLSPQGRQETLTALRRFRAILESYADIDEHVVATAAIRDASDGYDFVTEIERETGFSVRVLSGAEEAYFSTEGVRCAHHNVVGVVGDLGGASLELKWLDDDRAAEGITLALGPFSLGAPAPLALGPVTKRIHQRLAPNKGQFESKLFHAVGGAWRSLALIWMRKSGHPIEIVQQYEMTGRDALDMTRFLAAQSNASLEKMAGVNRRRVESLSYAALVLHCLLETFGFETIRFSAYGLREGVLFDELDRETKFDDPLIAGAHVLGSHVGLSNDLGQILGDWACHFFESCDDVLVPRPAERLVRAAAELSDLGARLHPDHRADLVYDQVLRAPIPGQDHWERCFLACALYTRYSGNPFGRDPAIVTRILGTEGVELATRLGLLLRLGCDLSAKSASLLGKSRLYQADRTLILTTEGGWNDLLLGEQTRKRARALSQNLRMGLKLGVD